MSNSLTIKKLGDLVTTQTQTAKHEARTIESRKNEWREVVESFDIDRLLAVQEEMDSFVDKMKVIAAKDSSEIDLTGEEAKNLMVEYLSNKTITEFLEARRSMVRDMVFKVVEERLRQEGVEDPENESGHIDVPELGKRFCKEGAGYKDPTLDVAKLKELLGDRFDEVTVTKIIPEKRVVEVDEDLLVELAVRDEDVKEAIQEAAIAGQPKNPRFNVRPMK